MSRHVWKQNFSFVEVGYERSTDRFFLTLNNHTLYGSSFAIMMALLRKTLKVPTNLLTVLENDRRLELEENSNLPMMNYGWAPDNLTNRNPSRALRSIEHITGVMKNY